MFPRPLRQKSLLKLSSNIKEIHTMITRHNISSWLLACMSHKHSEFKYHKLFSSQRFLKIVYEVIASPENKANAATTKVSWLLFQDHSFTSQHPHGAHNQLWIRSREIWHPLLPPEAWYPNGSQRYTKTKHPYTSNKNREKRKEPHTYNKQAEYGGTCL